MLIRDLMTASPACCNPADPIQHVAQLMVDHDCGEIPVCDGNALVGVITDRDIATRLVATGKLPTNVLARDIMTREVHTIRIDGELEDALDLMESKLVRRLPVVDSGGAVVGIVSQADLIAKSPTLKIARAMRSVSKKTRRQPRAAL